MAMFHAGRKSVFFTVFILVLVSVAGTAYAQGERPPLRFQQIGVEQGLSNSSALHIMQDSRGYIWIGTLDGLNRYNGYDFTLYTHDPIAYARIRFGHCTPTVRMILKRSSSSAIPRARA